jgi:hypothetical protein
MTFAKSTTATKQQIRNYYADQGYVSRVDGDGRVTFHRGGLRWQDGLWQENYLVQADGTICIK